MRLGNRFMLLLMDWTLVNWRSKFRFGSPLTSFSSFFCAHIFSEQRYLLANRAWSTVGNFWRWISHRFRTFSQVEIALRLGGTTVDGGLTTAAAVLPVLLLLRLLLLHYRSIFLSAIHHTTLQLCRWALHGLNLTVFLWSSTNWWSYSVSSLCIVLFPPERTTTRRNCLNTQQQEEIVIRE